MTLKKEGRLKLMRENKTRYLVALITFIVLSTIVIPIVSSQTTSSATVEITFPGNRATVDGHRITIDGTSTGLKDTDLHLYVLVHPLSTSLWWVQPKVDINRDGSWITRIYIGESDIGNNEDYVIKAILTSEILHEGNTFKVNELPSYVVDAQIIVTREDTGPLIWILSPKGLAVIGIIIAMIFGILGIRQWRKNK